MKQQNTGLIVKSKLTEKFTIIPNSVLTDRKLGLKAKGLLCILLSLPSDWAVYKSQLQQFSTDGRDATSASFNELVDNGYITAIRRINDKGHFMGWDYVVYNERVEPITEKPITDNPSSVNPSLQSTNIQSTNIQIKNTSTNTGATIKLKNIIVLGLNLTSVQFDKFVEDKSFNGYWNKELLQQYQQTINEYLNLINE